VHIRDPMSTMAPGIETARETSAFLEEVRAFLSMALTDDLRQAGRDTVGVHSDIGACRVWHQRLYDKGWIAPAWPREHGGTGWAATKRLMFERECAASDAPVLFAAGLRSLGPLLIAAGTPSQRERYLPAILNGTDLWCQGFSEAGAGSDLAALRTRAIRQGDHYVVSGSKLWTTGAHIANRMFCLVRTASAAKPQSGITFLLIDMHAPGISVRPIRSIAGDHEFNEVILDEVRVSDADRVGAENDGWSVAKLLMRLARGNNTTSGHLWRAFRQAAMLVEVHANGNGCLKSRLAELKCQLRAFEAMEVSAPSEETQSGKTDLWPSLLKISATELHQEIATVALDAAGPAAMTAIAECSDPWLHVGRFATAKYLATRAASIYSGTNETHRNLIARQIMG